MRLEWPLKDIKINQYYGNPNPVYAPLGLKGHNGIDLNAAHGTPVYASHDGIAHYEVDNYSGHGVVIISQTPTTYKGQQVYLKSIYWHLVDSSKEPQFTSPIEAGYKEVKTGDLIGYADNTGFSLGTHTHYGVKFLKDLTSGQNVEQDNGYLGALDPFPYLPPIKYHFTSPMESGDHSDQVNDLQHFLYQHGYMDLVAYDQQGIYGERTAKGVLAFQEDHVPLSFYEKWVLSGHRVGEKTLAVLNSF